MDRDFSSQSTACMKQLMEVFDFSQVSSGLNTQCSILIEVYEPPVETVADHLRPPVQYHCNID